MLPPSIIRAANNSDLAQIISLVLPIQQVEFNVPVTIEGQPDLLDIETNYHKTGGGFWVADSGQLLVGTAGLIHIGQNAGIVRKMFVRKEFRGKETGIAQSLVNILIQHSRAAGITDLYLGSVDSMKAAHRFYERNGFAQITKGDMPSHFPLMPADNIFYHLHLG